MVCFRIIIGAPVPNLRQKIIEGKIALELIQGNQEIIENVEGFKYPLKVVVSVEDDIITVIINYPLKKGRKR